MNSEHVQSHFSGPVNLKSNCKRLHALRDLDAGRFERGELLAERLDLLGARGRVVGAEKE